MLRKEKLLILLLLLVNLKISAQNYDSEVLNYSSKYEIKNQKLIETIEYVIQINTTQGEDLTNVEIFFSEGDKVQINKAFINDQLGNEIRKLKKKEITVQSAISDYSLYENDYVQTFTLKHNIYPYQLDISYTIEYSNFLHITDWSPVLDYSTPTKYAELIIITPSDYGISYSLNNISDPDIANNQANTIYSWSSSYKADIEQELFSLPYEDLAPKVRVIPKEFNFGYPGSFESWQSFGDWQYGLIKGRDRLPVDEINNIERIIDDLDTKEDIIKALYHYLQDNTRYVSVNINIGGLQPYPAKYVASKKYGDCKALSNYMMALLEAADIKSFYTKVYSSYNPVKFKENFPSQQFNHVILCVPNENDTLWLECTDNINPFGYIGISNHNRKALIVNSVDSKLVNIPGLKSEDVLSEREIDFKIDNRGYCSATLDFAYRGAQFESLNYINSSYNDHDKRRVIENYIPFKNFELINWGIDKKNRDSRIIKLTANVNLKQYTKRYGDYLVFFPFPIQLYRFEKPDERKNTLRFNIPIATNDDIDLHYDQNLDIESMPQNKEIVSEFGSYYFKVVPISSTQIKFERSLFINMGTYELSDYKKFYNFIEEIKENEKRNKIIFK